MKLMKNKMLEKISLTFLVFLLTLTASAQIVTLPLGSRSVSEQKNTSFNSRSIDDTLQLPFFEDFSAPSSNPNSERWIGNSVFINATYPIRPPSLGVATFDGLDAFGEPYGASANSEAADTLTSSPIDLSYPASDSIYLSFYYQPKGIGNYPEFVDSFLLEFKNPDDSLWRWKWGTKGEDFPQTQKEFLQVMIPIADTAFLKRGFQFRFRNYAQQNGSWDHWHLDYVKLDRNRFRNDTSTVDYSFMYPPRSILRTYQSVPLWHFLPQAIDNMDENYFLSLANLSVASSFQIYKYYYINESFSVAKRDSFTASKGPLQPRLEYNFFEAVKYTYEDPGTEWTQYRLQHYLSLEGGSPDFYSPNDTAEYIQVLSNYYALDDGTAEERLSLNNNGGGFVSQRFDTYLSDTLKSVQFYFNKTNELGAGQEFFIMIWGAGANQPGELLMSQGEVLPQSDGLNRFVTYELETPLYLPAGSYYIGWSQASNFAMNVGFDRNINNNDRIFYDLTGTWFNFGAQQGTLMIRPLFRYVQDIFVSNPKVNREISTFSLYPNPASENLQVNVGRTGHSYSVFMRDLTGRVIWKDTMQSESKSFSIESISSGVYFISLYDDNSGEVMSQKLIISQR
ncbi:MAG: T9SS type A sorting domain-containing protein [Bacteroidia bacterium]